MSNSVIPSDWKAVRGSGYAVREELKTLGARWCRETSLWWVAPEKQVMAQLLVDNERSRR